jgi:hypothetical protein
MRRPWPSTIALSILASQDAVSPFASSVIAGPYATLGINFAKQSPEAAPDSFFVPYQTGAQRTGLVQIARITSSNDVYIQQ